MGACAVPPQPWLRYELVGRTDLQPAGEGAFAGRLHGADFRVDLHRGQTRVQVTVENTATTPVTVALGPDAGQSGKAIGEVLVRELVGGAPGPDMQPYAAMQPMVVESGHRATFFVDAPLGREPRLGQFLVFVIEARDAAGAVERRTLPIQVVQAGTLPPDAK